MSADNGVYILVTNRGRGKREYRVREFQCVENLTYEPDYPPSNPLLNREETIARFGKSKVFTDRKIAEGYATRVLEESLEKYRICEYGIVWLEYPTVRFPKNTETDGPEDGEENFFIQMDQPRY